MPGAFPGPSTDKTNFPGSWVLAPTQQRVGGRGGRSIATPQPVSPQPGRKKGENKEGRGCRVKAGCSQRRGRTKGPPPTGSTASDSIPVNHRGWHGAGQRWWPQHTVHTHTHTHPPLLLHAHTAGGADPAMALLYPLEHAGSSRPWHRAGGGQAAFGVILSFPPRRLPPRPSPARDAPDFFLLLQGC